MARSVMVALFQNRVQAAVPKSPAASCGETIPFTKGFRAENLW